MKYKVDPKLVEAAAEWWYQRIKSAFRRDNVSNIMFDDFATEPVPDPGMEIYKADIIEGISEKLEREGHVDILLKYFPDDMPPDPETALPEPDGSAVSELCKLHMTVTETRVTVRDGDDAPEKVIYQV